MSEVSTRLRVIDGLCLSVAMVAAVSPFADLWADRTWWLTVGIGLATAVGVTLLAERLRLGPLLSVLLLAVSYLLLGPAAAAPDRAAAGVLPTPDALRTLVVGAVESWRTVLTLPVPLGTSRGELVVPFLITLLGGFLATTFLWRTRFAGFAALVLVACFATAAAFGLHDASLPLARGALLVVVLLLWMRWRTLRGLRTSWLRRIGMGAAVVSLAGVAGWGIAAAVDGSQREVLREHVEPPLAELELKSPLARYRDFYKAHEGEVLFRFENLPAGHPRVRLATMDQFDGLVWNVTTADLETGTSAFRPAPNVQGGGAVQVAVGDYTGVWVPTIGTARGVTLTEDAASGSPRELLINTATGSIAMAGDVRPGDEFRIDWAARAEHTAEVAMLPADEEVPVPEMTSPAIEKLDLLAQQWVSRAGATTDYDRARAVEEGFRENGYYNDGLDEKLYGYSPSGHGAKRLADLVEDEERMVGNDEQYASAMAYAAQRMGLPARIVLGFDEIGADGAVRGDDIAAWVEIAFADHGWVPFFPTPPEDRTPPPLDEQDNPVPQPYVVQPPVLPEEPEDVQGVPPEGAGKDTSETSWDWLFAVLAHLWTVTKVLLLLLPVWLILLAKALRRRRRRRARDPLLQLSGGWREVTDRARDLGARLPAGHTRSENCVVLASRFGAAAPTELAVTADRHVFGAGNPTEAEIAAYWDDVRTALKRMRRQMPWWRRCWAVVSPVSLPWQHAGRAIRDGFRALGARITGLLRLGRAPRAGRAG